jgi:hypothetical protein
MNPSPDAGHMIRYWKEHPERLKERKSGQWKKRTPFPETGTLDEQIGWFRTELLKEANRINDPKARAGVLVQAMGTLKTAKEVGAPPTTKSEDEQYRDFLQRQVEKAEKG